VLLRAVAAAAVDDDDAIDRRARQLGDDGADRFGFVEREDDDGDGRSSASHTVIARSEATKQSRSSHAALDCFASLAMT
jgi:hypothetical protein